MVKKLEHQIGSKKTLKEIVDFLNKSCLPPYLIAKTADSKNSYATCRRINKKGGWETEKKMGWMMCLNTDAGGFKDTILHELGHDFMMEYTFGDRIKKVRNKPSIEESAEYSVITYHSESPGQPGEGWAIAFRDYFERPSFLKKESPKLYNFWKNVMKKNPDLKRTAMCIKKHIE